MNTINKIMNQSYKKENIKASSKKNSSPIYEEQLLIERLQNRIIQLENKVQFFGFAISEIEDVTN